MDFIRLFLNQNLMNSSITASCQYIPLSNRFFLNSFFETMVQILLAKLKGIVRFVCLGWHTLKTPGSEIDPERVHWGQTPFRVNADPEIRQLDAECHPELSQSDPIICQVCRKLTNSRVIFDPEWSLAPMDPFPGHANPGVFRVHGLKCKKNLSLL